MRAADKTTSYGYDANSNLTTQTNPNGTSVTQTFNAADELTSLVHKKSDGSTLSQFSYTYNANGSRVSKTTNGSVTNYSYDFDEQLTQVASPVTGTSSFTYDGLGRRVTRTAGGVTTTFYFSGNSITTETQGASVVAHYVSGVNRISRDASGSYEYYHTDGLGSTRQLSNDSQSVTQTTTYDAFGNIESSAGSSNNAYKYAGQWGYRNDGDDGLMHVGARYYDALVGRFITADTWLGEIGNPQSLNRYTYCEGDPVNHVDPTGHNVIVIANGGLLRIIIITIGRGARIIYKVFKTRNMARAAARSLNKNRPVTRVDPGHRGGPPHYHNEARPDIHHTWKSAADAAERRGAPGWKNWRE